VLVLVWWRVRPWRSLGLSAAALFLIVVSAAFVYPGGGVYALGFTGWFAVLGASMSDDPRLRWVAAGYAALCGLVALIAFGGYGMGSFLLVAFVSAVAIGVGWGWRQLQTSGLLRTRLAETVQHVETAERDVLMELERNRIAREVHDVVAHSLAVVIAQADGARFAAETKPASVVPALEAISDTARRALGEVRTMLHDLRTSGDDGVIPGPEDLAGLMEGIRALGVEVDEATFGDERPLGERTGLVLYRVAQEALTNAMRHGDRGDPVGFELDWGDREVVLVVTNAVPVEVVPATERAGHGITGMRERAADVGGDCSAGVGSNGRFRVRVALPIEAQAARPEPEPSNPLIELFAPLVPSPRA
jgi:signal transduction histidine kinase